MNTTMHIRTTVLPNGKIEIDAPQDMPAGTEVTVTVEHVAQEPKQRARDVLAHMEGHRLFKTAEEVDAYIREERESWER